MSLLLDALRKADRERSQQQAPAGIGPGDLTAKTQSPLLWVLLALLAIALVVLIVVVIWLWSAKPVVSVEQVATEAAIQTQSSGEGAAISSSPDVTQGEKFAMAQASAVSAKQKAESEVLDPAITPSQLGEPYAEVVVPDNAEASQTQNASTDSAANTEGEATNDSLSDADKEAVAQLYRQQDQQNDQEQDRPQANEQALVAARSDSAAEPEPENPDNLDGYYNVGGVRALPLTVQNAIPTLMYGQHNYRRGGDSNVVINGQVLREGDRINGSIVVDAIAADGVVLRYQDHHFRLRALSSWVNM
ncbi:general secretion pathway protein GspB [Gilvimarinus chinensis]|uniref:general secretion pathway protein GspB n=1 Tax=Gilvimarinus chinensis TaxID=396005 RepID=UPI00036F2096|nr:general secretion pathway protein GspB [Gilvimarinus chinensis]